MIQILLFWITSLKLISSRYSFLEQDHIISTAAYLWGETFREFSSGLLIYFYEPECDPCKQFWPELIKAAQNLDELQSNVQVARLDCYEDVQHCLNQGVKKFPTLIIYIDKNEPIEYDGPRTAEALVSWTRKVVDSHYDTIDEEEALFEKFSLALVVDTMTYSISSACKDLLDEVEVVRPHENLKYLLGNDPAAIVSQTEDIIPIKFDTSAKTIKREVNRMLYVDKLAVPNYSSEAFGELQQQEKGNQTVVFVFRTAYFSPFSLPSKAFDRLAKEHRNDNIEFAYVNTRGERLGFQLGNLFGINETSNMTVGILSKQDKVTKKYRMFLDESTTYEDLKKFFDDFKAGILQRYYMSAEIPKPKVKGYHYMKELVGLNYHEVTQDPRLNAFVMLYMSSCENCTDLEAMWESIAYKLRRRGNVVIGRIDMASNDVDGFEGIEYPTLIFYPEGREKAFAIYQGETNIKSIQEFLQNRIPSIGEDVEL